jgi:phage shock protein C
MDQHAPSARPDNLFGICHAIGETFGFNPLLLRLALLVAVMLNAEIALLAYAVLGVGVAAAKLFTWRDRKDVRHRTLVNG